MQTGTQIHMRKKTEQTKRVCVGRTLTSDTQKLETDREQKMSKNFFDILLYHLPLLALIRSFLDFVLSFF